MSHSTITALTFSLFLTSCATVFNHSVQPVKITSNPSGLTFRVTNSSNESVGNGVTPGEVQLKTSAGYMRPETYTIEFLRGNKRLGQQNLSASITGWFAGNILIGGLIGLLIVDPITGAMFTLPDEVNFTGQTMATLDHPSSGRLTIASIDQLSAAQRARLVRI